MPVNMNAIWVLDIVIALGMISAAIAVLVLGRKLGGVLEEPFCYEGRRAETG